ncbi:hypothetical protein OROGR_003832 [Orobanche gracilis]
MGMKTSPVSPAGKWLGFVTAVWVQAISGNNYTFSNYSDALKSLMGLTQLQLNSLSVAKDVGKAFGLLARLASDRLSTLSCSSLVRLKDSSAMASSGSLLAAGSNLSLIGRYHDVDEHGDSSDMHPAIRNFRKNRGPVSGILKGYVGLSTAIFTDICSALFANDPAKFLMMLAIVPFVVCLSAIFFHRGVSPYSTTSEESDETKYFGIINVLAVIIALYLLAYDLTGTHGPLFSQIFTAILLTLLSAPLSIPIYLAAKDLIRSGAKNEDIEQYAMGPLLDAQTEMTVGTTPLSEKVTEKMVETMPLSDVAEKKRPVLGEDHTIFEVLRTVDFWILFGSFWCGVGTGLR